MVYEALGIPLCYSIEELIFLTVWGKEKLFVIRDSKTVNQNGMNKVKEVWYVYILVFLKINTFNI